MQDKFIYVFDIDTRDKLLSQNYQLLKSDINKNIFVFENKTDISFSMNDVQFVLSNILTF